MIMIEGEWWQVDCMEDVLRVCREYINKEFADKAEEIWYYEALGYDE